jgi:hypothetical protein
MPDLLANQPSRLALMDRATTLPSWLGAMLGLDLRFSQEIIAALPPLPGQR